MQKITQIIFLLVLSIPSQGFGQYDFEEWKSDRYKAANTTANAPYLTSSEKEVVKYLNYVRMNPKLFADTYVKTYAKIKNKENIRQVKSLISDLYKSKPLAPYQPDELLSKASKSHADYMGKTGKIGHIGKGKKDPAQRIEDYVQWDNWVSENIQYGSSSPLEIVLLLLIDEKTPNLGHRKNIIDPRGTHIGMAISPHKTYKTNCVMNFTGGILP